MYYCSPYGVTAHAAEIRKLEFLPILDFSVTLLFPCDIRAHAVEQVPSPCGNQNFWFHGFWFLISVLHFRPLCDHKAHAVDHMPFPYENQNFWFRGFRFPISVLHFWSPCSCKAHATECRKLEFLLISNFNATLLFPFGIKAHEAE